MHFSLFSQEVNTPSQFRNEMGLFVGICNSGTDVHSWGKDGLGILHGINLGTGVFYTYKLNQSLGLRFNYFGSQLSGDDKDLVELESHPPRSYTFSSYLNEFSTLVEWRYIRKKDNNENEDITNNPVSQSNNKTKVLGDLIIPYIFGGVGMSYTDPKVNWDADPRPEQNKKDQDKVKKTYLQIPYGAGLKYLLSKSFTLNIEIKSILPLNDYLDGISFSANPDKNDSYIFLGLSLGYQF